MAKVSRKQQREKRRLRSRAKVNGGPDRPRLCLTVSNKRLYVQFVDDVNGVTMASVSTADKKAKGGKSVKDAEALGKRAAALAKDRGISRIVFNRSGYKFHGRVKAIADAVRDAGVSFS